MISSRTPEGLPGRCPVCGRRMRVEPSAYPVADACCPSCGHLLMLGKWPAQQPQRVATSHWPRSLVIAVVLAGIITVIWPISGIPAPTLIERLIIFAVGILLFARRLPKVAR